MRELNTEAKAENLEAVLAFIGDGLEAAGCPGKTSALIAVAVEEIFVNIANYAYAPEAGYVTVKYQIDPLSAVIVFSDSGTPYNPLEKADPDITLPAGERDIGGLGIFMVKKSMTELTYEHKDGKNILTMKKNFGEEASGR